MSGKDTSGKDAQPASVFDRKDSHPERAVTTDPDQKALLKELDQGLQETFPASDAVSVSQPSIAGTAEEEEALRRG